MNSHTYKLAPGDLGIAQTVLTMQQLINDASTHPAVRQAAIHIVREAQIGSRDRRGEIHAVFNWAKRHMRFTDDPYAREVLAHPAHTLETRAGDCDDYVVVMGGLLKALGRPTRIVTIRADRREPGRQSHVFLQAQADGQWITLDPTVPGANFGWTPQPLYGDPIVWGEMAQHLPPRAGLGRYVGLAQSEFPQPFPTAVAPGQSWSQTLQQLVSDFGAAGAAKLAYGQAGATTIGATQAAVQGSGTAGTAFGAGLGISAGTLILILGVGFVILTARRH
jgi:predicted transglutaminase-like cysteine proteinase